MLASCPSVSACIIASPTGHISVKFDIGNFFESLSREWEFSSIGAKISGTLLEDEVYFIVAGDKDFFRVKWYRAAGIAE